MLCLIFDLDGTLVNSLPGIVGSMNRCLLAHDLPAHSHAAIRSFVGDGLRTLAQRAAPAGAEPAVIESLVSQFKSDYAATWAQGTWAYPGIHHLLDELQKAGYPLAVLSNKTHQFTEVMTRAIFPLIHFSKVLGQQDGIPHKPHPAGALQIALSLGAAVENCVVIGDSTIDLETAANAGMQAIAVAWGYHDRKRLILAGATRLVEHPSELPGLLAEARSFKE